MKEKKAKSKEKILGEKKKCPNGICIEERNLRMEFCASLVSQHERATHTFSAIVPTEHTILLGGLARNVVHVSERKHLLTFLGLISCRVRARFLKPFFSLVLSL